MSGNAISEIVPLAAVVVGLLAFAAAAVWDLRARIVPDSASVAILLSACLHLATEGASPGLLAALPGHLLVAIAAFALAAWGFARGAVGGGDVKLLTVAAFWAGPALVLPFAVVVSLAGGALALACIAAETARSRLAGTPVTSVQLAQIRLPYAVAISAGGVWLLCCLKGLA